MTLRNLWGLASLVVIGFLSRTALHAGANFEAITAISIVSACYWRSRWSILVPLLALILSDLVIGNTTIFIFTWSGFAFGHLLAKVVAPRLPSKIFGQLAGATALSLVSVGIFFLWTNLGVVMQTVAYPDNLTGLIQSYINAIPFLRPQILAALIFTPLLMLLARMIWQELPSRQLLPKRVD